MSVPHFLCMTLTPLAQALLLFTALPKVPDAPPARALVILAFLVAFACYLWGLSDVEILPRTARRPLRLAVHSLVAAALSFVGLAIGASIIAGAAAAH